MDFRKKELLWSIGLLGTVYLGHYFGRLPIEMVSIVLKLELGFGVIIVVSHLHSKYIGDSLEDASETELAMEMMAEPQKLVALLVTIVVMIAAIIFSFYMMYSAYLDFVEIKPLLFEKLKNKFF